MKFHLPYKLLLLSILLSFLFGYMYRKPISVSSPLNIYASAIIVVIGIVLGFWTKRTILSRKTTLVPSGMPSMLITSGPFTFSRNPMHLSYFMIVSGIALYFQTIFSLIISLAYLFYINFKIIPLEEQNLLSKFPQEYQKYYQKVRRWI